MPTAKEGETGLEVLGELKRPLLLMFDGCKTSFEIRPVVLRGLAMPLNIGYRYMIQNRIDLLFSQEAVSLRGKVVKIPASNDATREVKLHVVGNHVIPPFSVNYIWATVAREEKTGKPLQPATLAAMREEGCYINGSRRFEASTQLHSWNHVIQKPNAEGRLKVGVMNTQPIPLKISNQALYGIAKPLQPYKPGNLCLMDAPKVQQFLENEEKLKNG